MRLISGIPAWVQMYFERLLARTGKKNVKEVFPNFSLFVYGGVNYAPYRSRMESLIGGSVPSVELFPASEGFIAYQDKRQRTRGCCSCWTTASTMGSCPLGRNPDNPVNGENSNKRLSIAEVELACPITRWCSTPTPACGATRSAIP
jgi:hypothetical protein